MGIKLKTATLSEPFEYISLSDSALDGEAEDFAEEFQKYREGTVDAPPLKPGESPTIFTLVPITSARLRGMLEDVREEHGRTTWTIAAAAAGIRSVSGLEGEDGKPFKIRHESRDGFPIVVNEQLDLLGAELLNEIGMILLTHNVPS